MDSFNWHLPTKVIFGSGILKNSKKYFKGFGKRALIITGKKSSQENGSLPLIKNYFRELNFDFQVETGIEPNPTVELATEIISRQRQYRPHFIVAVGGGSVIDCSKAIALGLRTNQPLEKFLWLGEKYTMQNPASVLPILAVPTLPASGSEVNKNSVLTWKHRNIKTVMFHELLFPKVAIIDPQLTINLTAEQSTYTAIDIMVHALETYLSTNKATFLQDQITLGICKTVKENLEIILQEPDNLHARENISLSGIMAQAGFSRGRTGGWPLHWLEHPLSAHYNLPHGLGLKMLIPAILEYDYQFNKNKIDHLLNYLFSNENLDSFKLWLEKLPGKFFLPQQIDLQKLARDAFELNSRFDELPNIKPMSIQDIVNIYQKIATG